MYKADRSSFLIKTLLLSLFLVFIQPAWAEDFNFPGLSGTVTVYEDQYGIPSIKGDSELDVIFMQGYLHARDRFFQMDRDRKGAAGRAAELFGAAALSSDVKTRTFGLGRSATKSWQALDAGTKGWLQAYANGVNTYLANNPLPPEYVGLELTKVDPWTPVDTLLIVNGMTAQQGLDDADIYATIRIGAYAYAGAIGGFNGQALFWEDTHRSAPPDGRVTAPDFLQSPAAEAAATTEAVATPGKGKSRIEWTGSLEVSDTTLALAKEYRQQMEKAPLARKYINAKEDPFGSNAWLIAGKHTASGNAMIANDPHMTLDIPSIWYESHLIFKRDGEDWFINGVNVPGLPASMLGCNNSGCWGFTNNYVDITDFYNEVFLTNALGLPTHSLYQGNPESLQHIFNSWFVNVIGDEVPDNIVRAGVGYTSGAITFVIPRRNAGPVIVPAADGKSGISMMYTGHQEQQTASVFQRIGMARNLDEFKDAMHYLDGGVQNVFWADIAGNIAWFTSSELPIREDLNNFTIDGLPPRFIRDGTGAAANEWLPVMNPQPHQSLGYEIMPLDEKPNLANPDSGYIANANNDAVGVTLDNNPFNEVRPGGNGLYYLGTHFAAYRMGRIDREIKAMIDAGHKITLDDMKTLQANVEMLDAELVLPTLMGIMSQVPVQPGSPMAQALDVLSTWDYSAHTGLGDGWDAGGDPLMMEAPSLEQVRNSAAATVFAMWRSMLVQNTIYATLTAAGLGDYLPPDTLAYNAFKYHLENYPTAGGVGASGIPFFSAGLAETVAGSLQMALDLLASDEFAPAYANSTTVLDYAWGKLHRIVFDHTLGGDMLNIPTAGGFTHLAPDLPGLARQGGYMTVDASSPAVNASTHSATADSVNGFMFGGGPSRRFIADVGPIAIDARQSLPGGQSGVFYSPNYASQLPLWLTNDTHDMAISEEDAAGVAVITTTFGPLTPAPASEEESNNE